MSEHEWTFSDSSQYDFTCDRCGCTDRSAEARMPCKGSRPVEPVLRPQRPMQAEFMIVGGFLTNWQNAIYKLTEEQFVGECMRLSNNQLDPQRVALIYRSLMKEAGL